MGSYPADREEGGETKRVKDKASSLPARGGPGRGRYLHLPRPVPNPETATMPTQLLSRPLHGRTGGLCQETGQMPRMSCGAQNPLQRDSGLPDKLHSHEVPRTPLRDHWRVARPQCRCGHVKVCSMFGEGVCQLVRPL